MAGAFPGGFVISHPQRAGSRSRSGAGHVVGERHAVLPLFVASSGNWAGFDLF